ncbi:MAG: ATP-binding cassette domain-containing protein [Acholeplasmataceae bacterium]
MLKINNLKKTFGVENLITKAIDDISIKFRQTEFVCVLGPSGCGKSTFLNLIGALDKPDSGEISLFGNPLSSFSDVELDQYRNHSIGFIFQTHNLIRHLNILENVEMGMSLSGVNATTRKNKALDLLNKINLIDHAYKKPNELSVGQGQRIAVIRAIANNPDIILADEPTGSVDSETAIQIMDLIAEVSQGKLVIMVTHDEELAQKYATRIIRLSDGKLISDSNPYHSSKKKEEKKVLNLKKTFISFKSSFISALKNLRYKVGRTLATAFASAIGIIGISLTLALSIGTHKEIKRFENEVLGHYPINISSNYDVAYSQQIPIPELPNNNPVVEEVPKSENIITENFNNYVLDYYNTNPEKFSGIVFRPKLKWTIYSYSTDSDGKITYTMFDQNIGASTIFMNQPYLWTHLIPEGDIFDIAYDFIYGERPETAYDPNNKTFGVVMVINKYNEISAYLLTKLGIEYIVNEDLSFDKIIGTEIILQLGSTNPKDIVYNDAIKLKITGIVRIKDTGISPLFVEGIAYQKELIDYLENNYDDVILSTDFINIYPANMDAKEDIKQYLANYNIINGFDENHPNHIKYNDESATLQTISKTALNAAALGLIGFSLISVIVSSVMVSIITYTSVVERTKEIGILRSLGARKKDISRIFNSENIIIGIISGILGIITAHILSIPINAILENYAKMRRIVKVLPIIDILMLMISISVAYIAGLVPSRMAAKKNPVDALREE